MTSDLYTELVSIPWWVGLLVVACLWAVYRLGRSCEGYSPLDDPDYLRDRADHETRS